jgi:hypothetical protein
MLKVIQSKHVLLQLLCEITSRQLRRLRLYNGLIYARRQEATADEIDKKREAIIRGIKENSASWYSRGLYLSTLRKHGVLYS